MIDILIFNHFMKKIAVFSVFHLAKHGKSIMKLVKMWTSIMQGPSLKYAIISSIPNSNGTHLP